MMQDVFLNQWVNFAGWWVLSSLRYLPVLIFAPPSDRIRMPASLKAALALGLALPAATAFWGQVQPLNALAIFDGLLANLAIGFLAVLGLNFSFAAVLFAGRVLDVQSGLGLTQVFDPSNRRPQPFFGTLFAYSLGFLFFVGDFHLELFRLLSAVSGDQAFSIYKNPEALFLVGARAFQTGLLMALVGMAILFVVDLAIAFLSRNLPQMNFLLLGFQIKPVIFVLVLAMTSFALVNPMLQLIRISLSVWGPNG
jgi:flagellar biosynthesis protein FliR